jgi:hypothetical protein
LGRGSRRFRGVLGGLLLGCPGEVADYPF